MRTRVDGARAFTPVVLLALPAFCAYLAATRPDHVLGVVATVGALLSLWIFGSLRLSGRRFSPALPEADADEQRARVEAALAEIAPRAGLGNVQVSISTASPAPVRLRIGRDRTAVFVNPARTARRDDSALRGAIALQVATVRNRPTLPLMIAFTVIALASFIATQIVVLQFTDDRALAAATVLAFGPLIMVMGVTLLGTVMVGGERRALRIDGEAVRIAGGPAPVADALSAVQTDEENVTRGNVDDPNPLLLPANLLFRALRRRFEDSRLRRIERLRRGDLPSA